MTSSIRIRWSSGGTGKASPEAGCPGGPSRSSGGPTAAGAIGLPARPNSNLVSARSNPLRAATAARSDRAEGPGRGWLRRRGRPYPRATGRAFRDVLDHPVEADVLVVLALLGLGGRREDRLGELVALSQAGRQSDRRRPCRARGTPSSRIRRGSRGRRPRSGGRAAGRQIMIRPRIASSGPRSGGSCPAARSSAANVRSRTPGRCRADGSGPSPPSPRTRTATARSAPGPCPGSASAARRRRPRSGPRRPGATARR